MNKAYFAILFLLSTQIALASEAPLIVATIKPVHSLVAGIAEGIAEPKLLLTTNQSPHHYSLRPSERRLLAEADIIFWVGPTLESFLSKLLHGKELEDRAISLIDAPGLKLLPSRQADHHDAHDDHHEHATIDPHIWLDTANADVLVDHITRELTRIDPEHRTQYQQNSARLHIKISQLRQELQQSLANMNKPFLTYHDGYQYFENEFGLLNLGFVSTAELQPGARHISELKKRIREKNIECIFYDAPNKPAILKPLLAGSQSKSYMLDPVGLLVTAGKQAWFDIMSTLAKQFVNCERNL